MENSKNPNANKQHDIHHDKAREEEVIRNRIQAKHEAEEADRELADGERSEMDATHGDDAIEVERNEGRRFTEFQEFAPFHGDLGDESEDMGDLSSTDRKHKNLYNSAASVGENQEGLDLDDAEALLIKKGRKAGVSYKDEDSYVNKDDQQGKRQK